MKTVQITLGSFDRVTSLVHKLARFDHDFDLVSGRYVIDAKSIMGILSLDLSRPLNLNVYAPDEEMDEILKVLEPYLSTKEK